MSKLLKHLLEEQNTSVYLHFSPRLRLIGSTESVAIPTAHQGNRLTFILTQGVRPAGSLTNSSTALP